MKLYSRGKVIFFTLAALISGFLIALGVGIIDSAGINPKSEKDTAQYSVEDTVQGTVQLPAGSMPPGESIPPEELQRVNNTSAYTGDELENIWVYEQMNRGVVNITTETLALNWFLEPVPMQGGTGSGSIIDKKGYILTNYHVVENAYKVFLTLADGEQYEGTVVGKDPENDLAVLKFDPAGKDLTIIPFGTSSGLKVGQKVLAIGNPFAFERTLTTGIISGLGRPIRGINNLIIRDMIQTDASINPGNSGGPLLNSRGQMIGVNTMIYSPSGGSVGIGFAIPADTARRIVPELINYGMVKRGWIDIVPVQLDKNLVEYAGLPTAKGLLVSKVTRGSSAEKAGLRGGDPDKPVRYGRSIIYLGGDVIVEIDKMPVSTLADLFSALEDNKPGDEVEVVVLRGRQQRSFNIKLSGRPEGLSWE